MVMNVIMCSYWGDVHLYNVCLWFGNDACFMILDYCVIYAIFLIKLLHVPCILQTFNTETVILNLNWKYRNTLWYTIRYIYFANITMGFHLHQPTPAWLNITYMYFVFQNLQLDLLIGCNFQCSLAILCHMHDN